jgi:alkanesulfonate monooxygenase SsuD/methylene tetrahydromethanopterin reductase-like flavin-dependent oxidoreductase (luciferase family)
MDRISALRNIEDALRSFERGEVDLATTERQVVNVLRTYATDFEGEEELAAYRADGDEQAEGLVVVATSPEEAAARVRDLLDADDDLTVTVDRLG